MRLMRGWWLGLLLVFGAQADEVLLTLKNGNGDLIRTFTRAQLTSLPQHHFHTITAWTQGSNSYEGPALEQVLQGTGAKRIAMTALNHYRYELDLRPFSSYPAILAMSENGKPLTRRNKGPLWLLLPFSDRPDLKTPENEAAMVWQLVAIEIIR